jgi:hypothetical protein
MAWEQYLLVTSTLRRLAWHHYSVPGTRVSSGALSSLSGYLMSLCPYMVPAGTLGPVHSIVSGLVAQRVHAHHDLRLTCFASANIDVGKIYMHVRIGRAHSAESSASMIALPCTH